MKMNMKMIICIAVFAFSIPSVQAHTRLNLHVGEVKTLKVGDVTRVALGRDDVLATRLLATGELVLIPNKAGDCDLTLWQGEKKSTYRIHVIPYNVSVAERIVKSLLAQFSRVKVRTTNKFVIAEGEIPPEQYKQMVGLLEDIPNVKSLLRPQKFSMEPMVKTKLYVLEVDKTLKKELGIKWGDSLDGPTISVASTLLPNNQYRVSSQGDDINWVESLAGLPIGEAFLFPHFGWTASLASRIQLIEENGLGRTIAEPTLVTRSGETSKFVSGGEFPFVFSQQGEDRTEFKEYGIIVDIAPVVKGNEILVSIKTTNSSIDFSTSVNNVPGLITRHAESVINVKSGETIAISGLVSVFDAQALKKFPVLADIPFLGRLFRSKRSDQSRNELLILATPEIVNPKHLPSASANAQRHIDELEQVQSGYIDDELLDKE